MEYDHRHANADPNTHGAIVLEKIMWNIECLILRVREHHSRCYSSILNIIDHVLISSLNWKCAIIIIATTCFESVLNQVCCADMSSIQQQNTRWSSCPKRKRKALATDCVPAAKTVLSLTSCLSIFWSERERERDTSGHLIRVFPPRIWS